MLAVMVRRFRSLRAGLAVGAVLAGAISVVAVAPRPAAAASYPELQVLDPGPVDMSFQITPDGLWTVYTVGGGAALRSVPTSGGRVRTLHTGAGFGTQVSPDSGRVVYDDSTTLWSQPVAGGPETVLGTFGGIAFDQVTISGDSRWVLFRSDKAAPGVRFDLYRVSIDGGPAVQLNPPLVAGGSVEYFEVSHDGATVAYRADQDTDGVFELYTVPSTGGPATKISGPLVAGGSVQNAFGWAPDDSWLVYQADARVVGRYDLYSSTPTGARALLSDDPSNLSASGWLFAPDASMVVVRLGNTAGATKLLRSDRSGTDRQVLTASTTAMEIVNDATHISLTAQRVVFTFFTGTDYRTASVRLDGTGRVTLSTSALAHSIDRTGTRLAYAENVGARTVVFIRPIDGSGTVTTLADPGSVVLGFAADGATVVVRTGTDVLSIRLDGSGATPVAGPKPPFTETTDARATTDGRHVVLIQDRYTDGTGALLSAGPAFDFNDTTAFTPLPPTRVLDTRLEQQIGFSGPKPVAGETVRLKVRGRSGVPDSDDVRAVVLNVTATEASGPGYVTVWPAGATRPLASSLNLEAVGQTRPNLVTVTLGAAGSVDLFTQSGTHLVADVAGYYSGSAGAMAGRFFPLNPGRVLDTRDGPRPGAGATVRLPLAGRAGLPGTGLSAVVLNVTATEAGAAGFVTVWPSGLPRPLASNLNLERAGQTIPNQVIVPVGADGAVQLYTQSGTHLVADVAGWFTDGTEGLGTSGLYRSFSPIRMVDTRPASRQGWSGGKPGPGTVVPVSFSVPGEGSIAYTANVTVTEANGPGFVTAWPSDLPRPLASNLNTDAVGQTIPNHVTVRAGRPGEDFRLFTFTGGHLVVDITGSYFA